jgi:hypothetical protein
MSEAQPSEKMMVVHLDRLAPYRGTTQDKRPEGRSSWTVITMRTEPQRRKVRPVTDVTSIARRIEEMAVHL